MSELYVALFVAAAVVLAWVLLVNFRDRSKARQAAEKKAAPTFEEPAPRAAAEPSGVSELPNVVSEAIAVLTWQVPVPAGRVESEIRGMRRVGSKPLLFGWRAEGTQDFTAEPGADRIEALQLGVLLATRSGPLHAMEYTEFHELVTKLSSSLGAQCSMPEMAEVLAKARALDQQCAAVDAQLSLVIQASQVLSAQAIAAAAQSLGLEQRGESRFAMGPIYQQRFSVFPGDSGNSLVLLLDVPRTAQPRMAFEEMAQAGQAMSLALSAELVDESGRRLEQKDFEIISEQVSAKEQQLREIGIEPGSPIALRLFL